VQWDPGAWLIFTSRRLLSGFKSTRAAPYEALHVPYNSLRKKRLAARHHSGAKNINNIMKGGKKTYAQFSITRSFPQCDHPRVGQSV